MAYEQILYRVTDKVAVLTLNRPDRLNAWTPVMHNEVKAAMRAASDDLDVRVIVLTGAGRGFCAGADMNALQGIQSGERRERVADEPFDKQAHPSFQRTYSYFPAVPKPIIAAVNGPCAGLGMVIALYADMRFASENAVFMTAFSRRGLIAEHGISWLLPRLVGLANAADLLFSARRVAAAEAHAIGLVSRVFAAEKFETDVLAYAKMLASEVSPRSLREMKRESGTRSSRRSAKQSTPPTRTWAQASPRKILRKASRILSRSARRLFRGGEGLNAPVPLAKNGTRQPCKARVSARGLAPNPHTRLKSLKPEAKRHDDTRP